MTIFILLFLVNTGFTQEMELGPRITVTSSKASLIDDSQNFSGGSAKLGYQFGVFLRVKFFGLHFQPELLYSNTKGGVIIEVPEGLIEVEHSYKKIDLPLILTYSMGPVRLQAGPSLSILTKADNGFVDTKAVYNSVTVKYQAGVGVDIKKFLIDVKFEGNLSSFLNDPNDVFIDQRQGHIIFALGYKLF